GLVGMELSCAPACGAGWVSAAVDGYRELGSVDYSRSSGRPGGGFPGADRGSRGSGGAVLATRWRPEVVLYGHVALIHCRLGALGARSKRRMKIYGRETVS